MRHPTQVTQHPSLGDHATIILPLANPPVFEHPEALSLSLSLSLSLLQPSLGGLGHGCYGRYKRERRAAKSGSFCSCSEDCNYTLPYILPPFFPSTPHTIMGPKGVPAEQLLKKAIANGYKQGAHRVQDSIRDNIKYIKKTFKD